jgi:hypothetical protein
MACANLIPYFIRKHRPDKSLCLYIQSHYNNVWINRRIFTKLDIVTQYDNLLGNASVITEGEP